jgi:hypothetical protein
VALAQQYVEQAQHGGQVPRAAQPPHAARQLQGRRARRLAFALAPRLALPWQRRR